MRLRLSSRTKRLALGVLTVAACHSQKPAAEIRLGYVSTGLTGLIVQIMRDDSIPGRHDLTLTYQGFSDPSAANQALTLGQYDVNIAMGINVVALARAQGRPIQYFFPTLLSSASVLVRHNSSYRSLANLKGRKIGWYGISSGGGSGFYVLARSDGFNPTRDFQLIKLAPAALVPSIARDDLAAIVTFEPYVSQLLGTGNYRELYGPFSKEWSDRTGFPMEMAGMAASDSWIAQHPKEAQSLIAAWNEAVGRFRGDVVGVLRRYSTVLGLDDTVAMQLAVERIPRAFVTEWGSLNASMSRMLSTLAADSALIPAVPAGLIRRIDPK